MGFAQFFDAPVGRGDDGGMRTLNRSPHIEVGFREGVCAALRADGQQLAKEMAGHSNEVAATRARAELRLLRHLRNIRNVMIFSR